MLAGLVASAASLPLAAGALFAARGYARAVVRYRLLGAAFVLVAGLPPLAFGAALLRPAGSAGAGVAGPAGPLEALAPQVVASAALLGLALLLALALDVVRVLRVKHGAAMFGRSAVRGARLGASEAVATPTAIGYLHPAVIVPAGFAGRVDAGEWAAVLAHECAHLARGDDWAKAVQSALLRAGWWLPGLWLLGRALDLERELASDERAAGLTGPRRYAACLLRLATDRGSDVAPALWGRRAHLAIRVERLLRPSPGAGTLARAAGMGAFSAAALAAVLGALVAVPGTRLTGPAVAAGRAASARSIPSAGPTARAAAHRAQPAHRPRLAATPHRLTLPAGASSIASAAAGVPPADTPRRPAPSTIVAAHPRPLAPPTAATRATAAALAAVAPVPAAAAVPVAIPALAVRGRTPAAAAQPLRARSAAPRTVAFAAPSRRACRTCTAPKSAAADGFGSAGAFSAAAPADAEGGGSDDLTRVPALWIRLPSPAPNP